MTPHDSITTVPTMFSDTGRAWLRDQAAVRALHKCDPQDDATIAMWIVEAPWANIFWHSYMVSVVHLRPIRKMVAPILHDPNATHELLVYALNPAFPRQPVMDGKFPSLLTPANFGAQLVGQTDQDAAAKAEAAVSLIISGELNPDTDARRSWILCSATT